MSEILQNGSIENILNDQNNIDSFLGHFSFAQDKERDQEERGKILDQGNNQEQEGEEKFKNLNKFFDTDSEDYIGNTQAQATRKEQGNCASLLGELRSRGLCYPPVIGGGCFFLKGDEDLAYDKKSKVFGDDSQSNDQQHSQSGPVTARNAISMLTSFAKNVIELANEHGEDYVRDLESKYIKSLKENNKNNDIENNADNNNSEIKQQERELGEESNSPARDNDDNEELSSELEIFAGLSSGGGGAELQGENENEEEDPKKKKSKGEDIATNLSPEERALMEELEATKEAARKASKSGDKDEQKSAEEAAKQAARDIDEYAEKEANKGVNTAAANQTRQKSESQEMEGSVEKALKDKQRDLKDSSKQGGQDPQGSQASQGSKFMNANTSAKENTKGASAAKPMLPEGSSSWVEASKNVPKGYGPQAIDAMNNRDRKPN